MKTFVIFLIQIYQATLSPDHGWMSSRHPGGYCRFQPTCSNYAIEAIDQHGIIKGGFLAVARITRCHPWSPIGPDPVLSRDHN
jgi:putative membrane protein insertion efficiency factor